MQCCTQLLEGDGRPRDILQTQRAGAYMVLKGKWNQ